MNASKKTPATVDAYIRTFPPKVRAILGKLRETVTRTAPGAVESISYAMPGYKLDGRPLVYFGAWKDHIGFYPTPSGTKAFREELAVYAHAKGSVRFPLDQPIPYELVRRIVRYRMTEASASVKRPSRPALRARVAMPEDVRDALEERNLRDAYDARPPYQRNDYLGWITSAARDETRKKRVEQMLEELEAGDVYKKMAWGPKAA